MFEGKPPLAATAHDDPASAGAQDDLRAVSWRELKAKLTAARELRAALADSIEPSAASFDAQSARHLASLHEHDVKHIDNAVNPDDSGNRKGVGGNISAPHRQHRPATRGNT